MLQTTVKQPKNCVSLPRPHLPNVCLFVDQREATVLLLSLFYAGSSKPLFTHAALEEAPLTNKANLQSASKNRAGTEEQGLC